MLYRIATLLIWIFCTTTALAQNTKPKLVIGIVIDQMRNDYLYRFHDHYGDGGFKRILKDGFQFKNAHYNYIPTYTGPGHASIYTGTTPRFHGIIGNSWYNRKLEKMIYCTEDSLSVAVGGSGSNGAMSPRNLISTTFSDQLRLNSNFRSKVIGVAIKDRGAILPAGHAANAAYWFDPESGHFITSTYYMGQLPDWVDTFNNQNLVSKYLKQSWGTVKDISSYVESESDNNQYEKNIGSKTTPTFPYDLKKISKGPEDYGFIRWTPYGNTLTLDMAIAAIEGENLGQDKFTDLLAVSFSSTDYIGHGFGPHSKELQDTYVRLDLELARLLKYLDEKIGKEEYLIFLTADHGVVHVPSYLTSKKIAAGYMNGESLKASVQKKIKDNFDIEDLLLDASNHQLFINKASVKENGINEQSLYRDLKDHLLNNDGIFEVYSASQLSDVSHENEMNARLYRGYNMKRSGDMLIIPKVNFLLDDYGKKGTTHGSGFNYDTHVPILMFGNGISNGRSYRKVSITDIAPTISMLLDISLPNSSTGQPLIEIFE